MKSLIEKYIKTEDKVDLAFKFGFIFSEVCRDMKIELTPGIIQKASKLIWKELSENSVQKIRQNMHSTILAIIQEVTPNEDDVEKVV